MKYAFYIGLPLLLLIMIMTAKAEDTPNSLLESHLWEDRVVMLFAKDEANAMYMQQRDAFANTQDALTERDVIIYDIVRYSHVKQNNAILPHISAQTFFDAFNAQTNNHPFTLLLIGKDGTIKRTEHNMVPPESLFRDIDAMPMRQREIKK